MSNDLPICTFDLETDPFKAGRFPIPFCSDVFNGTQHLTTWGDRCIREALDRIMAYPALWYAHNGGKFDFHYLLPFLPRNRIQKLLTINGRIVQIKFSNGTELRDSYALIPRPLREWAKEDIDFAKLEKDVREEHRPEIIRYLKKDTEYLHEMLTAFVDRYGLHLTLASAAFKILHKDFGVPAVHISEAMDAKFRPFYFAGRVEYHALGLIPFPTVSIDINSSFPWSMTKEHWDGETYIEQSTWPVRNAAQSFYKVECVSNGAFPYRADDGGVNFPSDKTPRIYYITGWELEIARALRLVDRIRLISAYTPVATRNYKEFIDYFYAIKQNAGASSNPGERLFAKLLMNSGYGKFGMDSREFCESVIRDWRDEPPRRKDKDGNFTDLPWQIQKDDEKLGITIYERPTFNKHTRFNNVCVAASITGLSRALLLSSLHKCERVVYCDTDSIIAGRVEGLEIGEGLGQWKVEHEFDELHIGGKKLYAGRDKNSGLWKVASKGVRLSAQEVIEVANGKDISYQFQAPTYTIRSTKQSEDGKSEWYRFTTRTVRRADRQSRKAKMLD
jgi:hypothetical protein